MQIIINQKQIKIQVGHGFRPKHFFLNEIIQIPLENHFYANESFKEKFIEQYLIFIKFTPLPLRICVILNQIRKNCPTLQSNRLFEWWTEQKRKWKKFLFFKCAKSNQMCTQIKKNIVSFSMTLVQVHIVLLPTIQTNFSIDHHLCDWQPAGLAPPF